MDLENLSCDTERRDMMKAICNFSNFCESLVFKFGKYILFYFLGIFRIVLILGACAVRGTFCHLNLKV